MDYSFNAEAAKMYGVDEAVFLHNLYWWIAKNQANGRHFHDGRSWTYNSMDAFAKLFPFWTRRQIERIIKKLKNNGAIYIGNYNALSFDRTQWYALSETVNSIYANGEITSHQTVTPIPLNGEITYHQTVTTIPDSKPDINADSKPDKKKGAFTPPSLDEVKAYSAQRQSDVDPNRFFDYFEASGWVDSKGNKVRNWKQKLISWEGRNGTNRSNQNAGLPPGDTGTHKPKFGTVIE